MENFYCDKFTEDEEMLLQELKSNCDDGREIDLEDSAVIFHKMGTLYFQRSKTYSTTKGMICLIRCAVLLNAAMIRTKGNADVIKQDLKNLDQYLLKSANAEKIDVDLFKKSELVKSSVNKMRKDVNEKLCEIPKVKESKSRDGLLKQERDKVVAIESLQNKITDDYTEIMANVATECEKIMGKAPCKFAIVGMGSLARKEITPYSDFEHVIVLDSKFDGKNEKILIYFRWYSVIFQIILVNLGETIVPSVLNKTNSKLGSWFYDDVANCGISFDGTFPWACKYPLGRQQFTTNKNWITELIKSVPDMLKYLKSDESLKNGYHLADILTKICYVHGDKSLYKEFESGVNDILKKPNEALRQEILNQIVDDLESFAVRSVLLKITDKGKYNVKKDIYRLTTLFIAAMGRIHKITVNSCFDIIRQLAEKDVISNNTMHHLMYAIATACEIRLRWYIVNKRQKDVITDMDATSKLLEMIGEICTVSYFQIAYALQCDISNQFKLKKKHFYSHPHLLNINIYSSFQNTKKVEDYINTFNITSKEQRLLKFDDCFKMLTTKQTVVMPTGTEEEKLDEKYHLMGQQLMNMNQFNDAKEYLEKSLAIQQTKSSDIAIEKDKAITLHEIGQCLIKMNKLTDAKEYFVKALNIQRTISSDITSDKDMASTLHQIGRCLIKMNELINAKEYLEKALVIRQTISNDVATDKDVAITLNQIGRCLIRQNKLIDAKKHLEKALKVKLTISNDVGTDREVAISLQEIGRRLMKMNKLTNAKECFEKALEINKQISSYLTADRNVASTLSDLGGCLIKMRKHADAKDILEECLKLNQQTSNDISTDRQVANTLIQLGRCSRLINKFPDAIEYLEKALEINQRISCDIGTERPMVNCLIEIGRCYTKMNRHFEAKEYLEKALKLNHEISSNVGTDRDVAITLNAIGEFLMEMRKFPKAKKYLREALDINQQLFNSLVAKRDATYSLDLIGRCLIKMNKLTEAKEHFEKSLKIKQELSSVIDTNRDMAYSYNLIGGCLKKMNKISSAKEHFKIALKIYQQFSNEISRDKDVAFTLHQIGQCLIEMNKFTDAIEYLENSLDIKQRISRNLDSDRGIAFTLGAIGQCLKKMNKHIDAEEYLRKAFNINQREVASITTNEDMANFLH